MLLLSLTRGEGLVFTNTKDSTVIKIFPSKRETRKKFVIAIDAPRYISITRKRDSGKD